MSSRFPGSYRSGGPLASRLLQSLLPLVLALLTGALLLALLDRDPLAFYGDILSRGLLSPLGLEASITRSAPLFLLAAALIVAFRSGLWNLGVDGQFLLAAVTAAALAPLLATSLPSAAVLLLSMLGAMTIAALWSAVPAMLKASQGINEIITTLMMNFLGVSLANALVKLLLRDPGTTVPQTLTLAAGDRLPRLPGSTVHLGVLIGLGSLLGVHFLMTRTAFGLKLRGMDRAAITQRVADAARTLGLEEMLQRKPAALSGGQRQRVALGRALVRQPQVFLLDEPLSNLDARLRAAMRVEIARLHRSLGTTMVYVTHDQVEAMTLGQRIVVLDGGRIQQIDTPMALYERPANLFVATFLGSPAMNVLRGRLEDGAGGPVLVGEGGLRLPLPGLRVPESWERRELALGLRPEHLLRVGDPVRRDAEGDGDTDAGVGHDDAFEALVEVVEPVGSEVFVNLRVGDHALVARLPPTGLPQAGAVLSMKVAVGSVHFFDAVDGKRLEGDVFR